MTTLLDPPITAVPSLSVPTLRLDSVEGVFEPNGQGRGGVLRLDGCLPGPDDLAVPAAQVRRWGLRTGDLVRAARPDGTVLLVEGRPPEALRGRPDFAELTPVHPVERLRLETTPDRLTTRVIDLLAPIGKGQRGLIVAPPKAGKTMVLRSLAEAVAANHPECHLMVVLLDERPEEVTDMRRSVRGEVLASTFDRPAAEHCALAALAVERAKRLVEAGRDVVLLLDSLTRLCRAHNTTATAGRGRTLSGGVDAAALLGPKRVFGAARKVEGGGSLTILATALVETGSRADEYYFEELKSTGSMELRLDAALAARRLFPAVAPAASGTRREELLLRPEELEARRRLRRALVAQPPQQATEMLLERLRKTRGNAEFLRQILLNAPAEDRRTG